MDPKLKGGIHSLVRVTDRAGNQFVCPADALRDPNTVTEEEKEYCEPDAVGDTLGKS